MTTASDIGARAGAARVIADQPYGQVSDRQRIDLYLPRAENPPLVAYLHGGAWLEGSKVGSNGDGPIGLEGLLAAGIAVAGVGYRLTDEASWPAQEHDLTAAFAWLRENAGLGYDASRMGLLGPSAGGHLGAVASFLLAARAETALKAAVLWFPPADLAAMDADLAAIGAPDDCLTHADPDSPEARLIGGHIPDNPALATAASPLTYLAALPEGTVLPRFLILHGTQDFIVSHLQSVRLIDALAAHRPAPDLETVFYAGAGHGGEAFEARGPRARSVAFLAETLLNPTRQTP